MARSCLEFDLSDDSVSTSGALPTQAVGHISNDSICRWQFPPPAGGVQQIALISPSSSAEACSRVLSCIEPSNCLSQNSFAPPGPSAPGLHLKLPRGDIQ